MRVGEFALAVAEAGEIEPQHREAAPHQSVGDALGGKVVLAAGKAVGEQRGGAGRALGAVEGGGEHLSAGSGKLKALGRHGGLHLAAGMLQDARQTPAARGRVLPRAGRSRRRAGKGKLVEPGGIEPPTSSLRTTRSPSLAMAPSAGGMLRRGAIYNPAQPQVKNSGSPWKAVEKPTFRAVPPACCGLP